MDTVVVLLVVYVQVTKLMMTKFSLFFIFDALKPVYIHVLLEGSQNGQIVGCDDVKINEIHVIQINSRNQNCF